jgi:signal transduction histidine kinase
MGLFITRALAERHGGDLKIASRLGEGTTITIRLPADRLVRAFGKAALLIEA